MEYEQLKREIKEIAEIAGSVPQPFQEKCFELLMSNLLGGGAGSASGESSGGSRGDGSGDGPGSGGGNGGNGHSDSGATPIPIQSQLRVFMNKTGVTKVDLERVVLFDDGAAHFIREPTPKNVATGQMEWALLIALKNGIEQNKLEADPEDVRSMCQEKGFYDRKNFSSTFKKAANAALFRQPLEPQGEPQPLSSQGNTALAKLIKDIASTVPG